MQRISPLFSVLIICFVTLAQSQAPVPRPDPEFKKLQVVVGHWMEVGEYKAGPWGPAVKIKGEWTYEFALNGFVLQGHCTEKSAEGVVHYLEVDEFDAITKKIVDSVASDDGSRISGSIIFSGKNPVWVGTFVIGGKPYQFREPFELSADLMSGTAKGEFSEDGKTWVPFFEGTFTKVKPAPKK